MLLERNELNVLNSVQMTEKEFVSQILLMAAIKMFELNKLSSGKAAELAGMTRVQFLDVCGSYKVPVIDFTQQELENEIELFKT
ncbi:MAG TPA: UPF0175 family protein [Leptospiraceae bacterium]|nr:UPF0175 family protein [Leptospiraceae bacterium]HMW04224.1 UPF0175 family protein [Leptospiraceae bacterium]HMX34311.1 UPF0175 family protein [Leptospiraceae bacterium]HMY31270.1 UPF0175 family protein [Leptospiraceae bacterium]HMZ63383.1 UPF0175 family protein [Leptospiraceae bacterium]